MIRKVIKWTFRVILALFLLIVVFIITGIIYIRNIAVEKPSFASELKEARLKYDQVNDSLRIIGPNYLARIDSGMYQMYVEGAPFHRGQVMGALTADLHEWQEEAFIRQINKMVPDRFYLRFLKYFVTYFNRHIQDHIPRENLEEIYGESLYMNSTYDDLIGTPYMRILNYHAAHDIGHALQDKNFVAGCTSFAAWGEHSEDGELVVGRNFDFYVGDDFAKNKIVAFIRPDRGIPFGMVTWPGMTGVVSGMNMQQVTVTINAAKSAYPTEARTPISIVARHILQYASDIDEAIAIAKKFELFVSEAILVSSGKENRAVIIEKSPEKMDIFRPDSSLLFCSNHFQSAAFAGDINNNDFKRTSSTEYRYRRLQELTSGIKINELNTANILRNPYGMNDLPIGWGNEDALNQLIAHHSVIFRPAQYEMWVSTRPFQLGRMIRFNLKEIFEKRERGLKPDADIMADEILIRKAVLPYRKFRKLTEEIRAQKNTVDGKKIDSLIALNPQYYYGYEVAGDYFFDRDSFQKARYYYSKALTLKIPNKKDSLAIASRLNGGK